MLLLLELLLLLLLLLLVVVVSIFKGSLNEKACACMNKHHCTDFSLKKR